MRFIFSAIFALLLTAGYSQSDCLIVIPTRGTDSVVLNTNQILYAVQAPSSSTANIVIADFSNVQTRITLDSLIALLPDLIKFTDSQNNYPTAINKQQIRQILKSATNKAVLLVNWNKQLRYTSTQSYSSIRSLADACDSGASTPADGNGIISALPLGSVDIVGAVGSRLEVQNSSVQLDGKFLVGPDSSFIHNPTTDETFALGDLILGVGDETHKLFFSKPWYQYIVADGSNGNMTIRNGSGAGFVVYLVVGTGAGIDTVATFHQRGLGVYAGRSSDIGATLYANYLSSKGATNILQLDNNGSNRFIINPSGVQINSTYGLGNRTAAALSKTSSGYVPVFATDGTVLEGPRIFTGTGSPETVITAPVGSLYTRTNGGANTTLYVKESGTGNTGWIAK